MPNPSPAELRSLLDNLQPATALEALGDEAPAQLAIYKAEALMDLDRYQEAGELLDAVVDQLQAETLAEAERLRALAMSRFHLTDGAILAAYRAAQAAHGQELRADALAVVAMNYACKSCWGLTESTLREAIELSPNSPRVLTAQARVRVEADQRLEARAVYERLATLDVRWARAYAEWGLSHVAYLLGEFEQARTLAESALAYSDQIINPLFTLIQIALALEDAPAMQAAIERIQHRSPQAAGIGPLTEQLEKLRARLASDPNTRRRLVAFPTTIQRRDHCGPCTIELVLRYWKGGHDLTNDQIADKVKLPYRGTPPYRMREFFHLVGFDTVRCYVPVGKLKQLIDAGYPVIVEEEFPNSSHVAVAIGYDEAAGAIELQDPMTHAVSAVPFDELNRVRHTYLDGALIAFPAGQGHDKALARLDLFDEATLVWTDQASLALDEDHPQVAASLMARAVDKQPGLRMAWMLRLQAELTTWRTAQQAAPAQATGLAARLKRAEGQEPAAARERFYAVLAQARELHAEAEFVHLFEGRGAMLDGDTARALAAFERAKQIDPDDARTLAALAECHYALQDVDKALDAAWEAIQRNTSLAEANVWLARSLAYLGRDRPAAYHYARSAIDLAPGWWLPHLAMAEVHMQSSDYPAARREVDLALSISPNQPEARVLRGVLIAIEGDLAASATEIEATLAGPLPLTPMTIHKAQQGLCRILFQSRMFDEAMQQVKQLLALQPDNAWALQFLAAAYSEAAIQAGHQGDTLTIQEMRRLYDRAIAANEGADWVARDYLDYLSSLASARAAVGVAAGLRVTYPNNGHLVFLHAQYMARAEMAEQAARVMLKALERSDGIHDPQELYEAIDIILNSWGLEAGEKAVLEAAVPQGGAPMPDRLRALGLRLALHPDDKAERARELLLAALANDPDDAFSTLRLGDVAGSEAERERLYRRALLLAPRWLYARTQLANYLMDNGRYAEALEFTTGYEDASLDMLVAHGRGLLGAGRCEEAVAAFEQAIEQADPPPGWLLAFKWSAENDCGQHAAALATAQHGLASFPDEERWSTRAVTSLLNLDRLDEADQLVQDRQAHLTQVEALRARYELACARQDNQAALRLVEQLIQAQAEPLDEWQNTHVALLVKLGRSGEARQALEQRALDAAGWGAAAWAVMMTDDDAFTLELAERALALEPEHYAGLYVRAQALSDLGREAEAVQAFHTLRQAHPDEHNAYEKLALRLAVDGQVEQALELAERAVALGPFCPYAWATRGHVHFVRGQRAEARADLETGWKRADLQRRRRAYHFWWLLAVLQDDAQLAHTMKQKALDEADTAFELRVITQIETLING